MDILGRSVLMFVESLQGHELAAVPDAQHIDAATVAAAKAEEVDGIQHIRLALAVAANEAIQLGRKVQLRLGNVLIIKYSKVCQSHFEHKSTKNSS
jgi:hypothetical protein